MTCWNKKEKELLEEIRNTTLADDVIAMWFLGQCGFAIKYLDTVILIDPVLNDLKDEKGNTKRLFEPPFLSEECRCDYIFCTHKHSDHMARETIVPILSKNPETKVIIPGACEPILLDWKIPKEQIVSAEEKKTIPIKDADVVPISTAHPSHKKDELGRNMNLAYAIRFGKIQLLHLGDTYLTEELLADMKNLPQIDVLMTPINGRSFFRERKGIIGNMSAEEAAELTAELKPALTIPMHYDMMKGNAADPLRFVRELQNQTEGKQRWMLPGLGERVLYKAVDR